MVTKTSRRGFSYAQTQKIVIDFLNSLFKICWQLMAHTKIGRFTSLSLKAFEDVVFNRHQVIIDDDVSERLNEQVEFVDFLLKKEIKSYGISTGFADLRDISIGREKASQLSKNLLLSHDAGIGKNLSDEVVLGAMFIRLNSLCKGYSGFRIESLNTLVGMINARIIPLIPSNGSLGASGDLAFLARLGRAMQGEEVLVKYKGRTCFAREALTEESIAFFEPKAKEGLALTNGTSFMTSMIAIGYLREIHFFENLLAQLGLYLNAVGAIDGAFSCSIQNVRGQVGQQIIAEMLRKFFDKAPGINRIGIQDDYCIRCLPQILGPKLEVLIEQYPKILRELDAVTDNPLIFKAEEISDDISEERCIEFQGSKWAVISGGNFHGEYLTTIADNLLAINAKIILTLERQIAYLMNPARNKKKLPTYLIPSLANIGLQSGYMIPHYSAIALTQKITTLALPSQMFNITSGNETEDIVSFGATAGERLLEQLDLIDSFTQIYLTCVLQAYAINRGKYPEYRMHLAEEIFEHLQEFISQSIPLPFTEDAPFSERYIMAKEILDSKILRNIIRFPILSIVNDENKFLNTIHQKFYEYSSKGGKNERVNNNKF